MSDEICVLLILSEILCEEDKNKSSTKQRKIWMKEWLRKREKFSNVKLLKKLKETEPLDFKNYMRMDDETFQDLLQKVNPLIQKQNTIMRDAIPAEMRLAVTLRFLATGNSFQDLKFSNAISPQSIGKIVIETCEAIRKTLKDYIKLPNTTENWKLEAEKFELRSGFPHCIGAIDGKHVHIKRPSKSGSFYFNYKKTFSIVLMAIVNADCEFLLVDVGMNGRISDGGVFSDTKFYKKLTTNQLNIPEPEAILPGGEELPYVLVGDDAFPLRTDLMKPYKQNNLSREQELFNKKLSSARVKVEHAFGILSSRFRVLLTTINLCPEKVTSIVLACCYLHNFLRKRRGYVYTHIDETQTVENLIPMESAHSRNVTNQAKDIRNKFCGILNTGINN